ncbi:MAG: LysE family transporter [Parcubacteria group bacterium]|jgi:RhtB (resistance to homoserine/threonine) family protein
MQNYLLLIGTVALVHLLAAMSPGPDFFMAVRNSLAYSRKTGMWTAVGFGLGMGVHISYCALGLAVIISKSILLFSAIKFLGAGYLVYIGIKSFFSKSPHIEIKQEETKEDISALSAVKMGFLTNALNPKVTLFFLGLFTLVISPDIPKSVLLIVSLIMIVNTILWFSLVAVFFTQKRVRKVYERFEGVFSKFFGGLLILLGLKVALSKR